jgi:hypothetical protein
MTTLHRITLGLCFVAGLSSTQAQNTYPFPASGNVGIGTTNPNQRLEIGTNGGVGFSGTGLYSADKKLYSPADGDLEWMTHNAAGVHGFAVSHQGTKVVYLNTKGPSYLNGGNVGIGTTVPWQALDVNGSIVISDNAGTSTARIYLSKGDPNRYIYSTGSGAGGNNMYFGEYLAGGAQGFHWVSTYSGAEVMTINGVGNVGIGTANPTEKLSVNGTIRARDLVVESSGWADFVFADDYALTPLSEVESQIKAHKHLPGIPSASEVAEKGARVGEMQTKLLQKVEELTLYLIELKKENATLNARLEKLEK